MARNEERAIRRHGGVGYHDVSRRGVCLLVGKVEVGRMLYGKPAYGGAIYPDAARRLGLPDHGLAYRIRLCPHCKECFIAEKHFRICTSCRQGREKEILSAYTAERAAERAARRATVCARCGCAMTASRSTKRFCSDRCRNAERDAR
jgi:hypothetical protein